MRGPTGCAALLLALGLGLCAPGCSAPTQGPVVDPPELYPDRRSAQAAWHTFLWAWRSGDVEVLEQVLGWKMHARLRRELEANGPEAVSAWYRRDAADLEVEEAEWTSEGEALAYLRAVFRSSQVPRAEVRFSFVRRPDGWVVTERQGIH